MTVQGRGSKAVLAASNTYGFEVESTRWYDGVGTTGAKYEVKSTVDRGFRIWRDQHRSLTAAPRSFYVFVRMSESGTVRKLVRRDPTTVTQYVARAGGWVKSGHARRDGGGKERYIAPEVPFY